MEITYDPAKSYANLAKHGIPLWEAETFELEKAVIEPDIRKDYGENRFYAIGYLGEQLHVMIFTPRHGKIRVISLRKAKERRKYGQKI